MEFKKTGINLVPDTVNPTPDYYCTWQTQLYATCDGKPAKQRENMNEHSLFCGEKPFGWAEFYPEARRDLFIVMDDSWDVPPEGNSDLHGSLILDRQKFPEATDGAESNAEALKRLADRIKALGWKGLGGWVCCHEAKALVADLSEEEYWKVRLNDAELAGISYWKVDWGDKWWQVDFRRRLTEYGRKYAPSLVIEHALAKGVVPYADAFRTYDVPGIMSIPMTMFKLAELAGAEKAADGCMGLLNCEDEAYIAAAGGYSMGIMRHPYSGSFVDGRPDPSFPDLHRRVKTKMAEVTRAARWHRIAPAFGPDPDTMTVDTAELSDTWRFVDREAEMEAWWYNEEPIRFCMDGDLLTKTAPARISRGCTLPDAKPDSNGYVPFIVASRNPLGAFSIVTAARTVERDYFIPRCDITADSGDAELIGVFGEYASLTLNTAFEEISAVLIQDLAADEAYDITDCVSFDVGRLTIPGELIGKIGTSAQPEGDTSEPGVVIKLNVK